MSLVYTTECTNNTTLRISDLCTYPNLHFHKTYRHCMLYFSLWIIWHQQNQLGWENQLDTSHSQMICHLPFLLEMQHTTEPRCSVVCVYTAGLCAGWLGCIEGHPCNSSPIQVRITKLGPEVQNNFVTIPFVCGVDWPWAARSNLTYNPNLPHLEFVCGLTHHLFKWGFPNLDHKYILALLKSLLSLDSIDLELQYHF